MVCVGCCDGGGGQILGGCAHADVPAVGPVVGWCGLLAPQVGPLVANRNTA